MTKGLAYRGMTDEEREARGYMSQEQMKAMTKGLAYRGMTDEEREARGYMSEAQMKAMTKGLAYRGVDKDVDDEEETRLAKLDNAVAKLRGRNRREVFDRELQRLQRLKGKL